MAKNKMLDQADKILKKDFCPQLPEVRKGESQCEECRLRGYGVLDKEYRTLDESAGGYWVEFWTCPSCGARHRFASYPASNNWRNEGYSDEISCLAAQFLEFCREKGAITKADVKDLVCAHPRVAVAVPSFQRAIVEIVSNNLKWKNAIPMSKDEESRLVTKWAMRIILAGCIGGILLMYMWLFRWYPF